MVGKAAKQIQITQLTCFLLLGLVPLVGLVAIGFYSILLQDLQIAPANTAKPSSGPVHRKMSQFKVPLRLLSCFLRQKSACFKAIIWGAQKERVQ